MKIKIFTLFVALLTSSALWAYDFQSGDLYYNITSSSAPYTVEVTYQEKRSDYNYFGLTTATIPETVTYDGTTYSVTRIGEAAFNRCSSLTSVTIPNSVTSIGSDAFSGCFSLTSITIPNSVTSIGSFAFNGCFSLTSITIPNSVTSIGSNAFSGCFSLTSVTIPNSVTTIGNHPFYGCQSLESIVVEQGNVTYDSRENCNAIIETASNTLIIGCKNTTIPNSVTSIGEDAFFDCQNLNSIVIPNSITNIGEGAFCGCISLASINIPNSVIGIGEFAFGECISLASCTIGNGVRSIGSYAFNGCFSLTSITIPNSVTSIGGSAFFACRSLSSIVIPDGVTSIGDWAFSACTFVNGEFKNNSSLNAESNNYWGAEIVDVDIDGLLIRSDTVIDCRPYVISATIPNSVTSIGDKAFYNCSSLTSVTIGNGVTSIGDYAFCNAALTSIVVPDNVTFIGKGAFSDMEETLKSAVIGSGVKELNATFVECMSLESVILSEGLETIGDEVFNGCNSLNSVNIPHSVTSIGYAAFAGCLPLESIVIPSGVTTIGEYAFGFCISLTTVICKAIEVPELESDVFNRMPLSEATLYVPAESLEDYKAAEQWKEFGTILPLDKTPNSVENIQTTFVNGKKLLRNNQLLILREGKTYSVMGQEM